MDLHSCRAAYKSVAVSFIITTDNLFSHVHFKPELRNSMFMCFVFWNGSFGWQDQIVCMQKCIQILLDCVTDWLTEKSDTHSNNINVSCSTIFAWWPAFLLAANLTFFKMHFKSIHKSPCFANNNTAAYSPHNLNGAPQIEDEEHDRLVVHLLQASEDNEENKIPSHNLQNEIIFPKVACQVPPTSFTNSIILIPTWIRVGTTPVRTTPKAALRTSTTARIWQKNITSDMEWNVS